MEQGLFSRLQSYFDASYGGRYVEYLIKESVEEEPRLATQLFGVKRSDALRVEYPFQVGGRNRIADLAFLDPLTERPTCLIEIKYEDQKNPKNAAQLEDYLRYCRERSCKFLFLSQHLPPESLRGGLGGRGTLLLFSDLADGLKSSEGSVGALLRRFFVDRGLVMHKFDSKDLAHLKSFLFRLLNPWLGQGRSHTKEAMTGGVAESFGNLLRNMNIIAREVAANVPGRLPTIDFEFDPWVKPRQVQKDAKADPKARSISAYNAKDGGLLYVYGRTRLDDRSSSWLQIEFGIGFQVNAKDKDFHPFTFADVYSNAFKGEFVEARKSAKAGVLHNKQQAAIALKRRIDDAIERAIKRAPPRSQVAKLKKFRSALRSRA